MEEKLYELTYLIDSQLPSSEAEKIVKEIETFLQEKGGVVIKSHHLIPKTLAYPIKKKTSAFLGVLEFKLDPSKIDEIQKWLLGNNNILRYHIIKTKEIKEEKVKEKKRAPMETEKVELQRIEEKLKEILND